MPTLQTENGLEMVTYTGTYLGLHHVTGCYSIRCIELLLDNGSTENICHLWRDVYKQLQGISKGDKVKVTKLDNEFSIKKL